MVELPGTWEDMRKHEQIKSSVCNTNNMSNDMNNNMSNKSHDNMSNKSNSSMSSNNNNNNNNNNINQHQHQHQQQQQQQQQIQVQVQLVRIIYQDKTKEQQTTKEESYLCNWNTFGNQFNPFSCEGLYASLQQSKHQHGQPYCWWKESAGTIEIHRNHGKTHGLSRILSISTGYPNFVQGITINIKPPLALWVSCHDLLLFSVTLLRWRSHWKLLGVSCPRSRGNLELHPKYRTHPKKLSFVRDGNQTLVRS